VISSSKDPDMISKAFQSGVEDFLQKPIGLEMLKTRITMCLEDRLRRHKEKELETLLDIQRQKNIEHQKIIESFKNEISEKIETPIQVVMKTIGDLMKEDDNSSVKQYKGALIAILKSLGSHDLYKPTFEEIESSTKKWLETEYTSYEDKAIKTNRSKSYTGPESTTHSEKLFDLDRWTFDVESKDEGDLIKAVFSMFKNLGIVDEFKIDEKKLRTFIIEIKSNYNENPYHNFRHAVDVAQFVYCFLLLPQLQDYFSLLEKFSLLAAALCHDLDHPGLNNTFQVNAATPLSLLYNGNFYSSF
jgi:CheY-like chemotaxis protein